ncbi:hypothetical protein YA0002_25705 [Pseudomonas cichorii]|uniref:hypothetical protein n=1 Tax=Pseudomonas cichorii TaxID=36746 RepID=UPI0018E5DBFF|nr:hypothetical protein [Pseudomonas cichorii]MBI6856162.1 hypothetical protein [Pseudomonas cichorii]
MLHFISVNGDITVSGRETSVSLTFHYELFQACRSHGAIDLNIPLNGADRVFNADYMFSSDDQFFLIEFKSSKGDLRSENHKESACLLCEGLFNIPEALELHQQCHFAMWARKGHNDGLNTFFGVYEDLVCRSENLPSCGAVYIEPEHRFHNFDEPKVRSGEQLATDVAMKLVGLGRDDFLRYLEWLLWTRSDASSYEKNRELPITLFGTSFAGGIKSREFKSFQQLEAWAEPFIEKYNAAHTPAKPDPAPESPSTLKDKNSSGGNGPKF